MKVAFLYDDPGYIGGAELTMREFKAAAPQEITLTEDVDEAETVVLGNCVSFGPRLPEHLAGKRVIRYHNDLARYEDAYLHDWLERFAEHVFTSPFHRERYGLDGHLIPPAIDLDRFKCPRQSRKRSGGAVSIGSWQNPGKGQRALCEWADANDGITIYGGGPFIPSHPRVVYGGEIAPEKVAQTLWLFDTFVHLPTSPEPFGRAVVEAWAAGLRLIVNGLVGASYWITEQPEKLRSAAEDFWALVTEKVPA
jgi:glycosyltransferase involved in cell wall biosynthesis